MAIIAAMWRCLLAVLMTALAGSAWAAHGYALWGDLKYPEHFAHFDYVNPDAPKGGDLRLVSNIRLSTFDKYNPFTIKGSEPAYIQDLLFDSLLEGAMDEPGSGYGLLAKQVEVAADGLSATFYLRPEAKFHNGEPVLAQDVKYTFSMLMGEFAKPGLRTSLEDVRSVDVVSDRVVRFVFKAKKRELPLLVGAIPIFSHQWGAGKSFDKVVTELPIASGPYKVGPVIFGRDITYVRDSDYWAKNLNVKRGGDNFDNITVKIYKDNVARLEALKAGEFDMMQFYSAGDWTRRVNGKRFDTGELVKGSFQHRQASGFQSFVLNTRRSKFQDVRVREALGLALDFDWMSRMLFYGLYAPINGLFGNTDCDAKGMPSPEELTIMTPYKAELPAAAFGEMTTPIRTEAPGTSLRANLLRAQKLLQEAGWTFQNGALRNAQGEPMVIELLDSQESKQSTFSSWARNLNKLGIELKFRAVDFALYQQRVDKHDYDMIGLAFPGTHNPGQEYVDMFGSKSASVEGSGNYAGVRSPAIDAIIAKMVSANTKKELLPACHALDRVIAHSHYLIPMWASRTHNVAYNAWRLVKPANMPPYAESERWVIGTWWAKSALRALPQSTRPTASQPTAKP